MRILDTQEYLDQTLALLAEGVESVALPVAGDSMRPFLRPGDTVYLALPQHPLKKGDIVLFSRPNGRYILHRITGLTADGSFLILGDNQTLPESVRPEKIHAVAASALRKGARIAPGGLVWEFYAHPWRIAAPLRPCIAALRKKRKQ